MRGTHRPRRSLLAAGIATVLASSGLAVSSGPVEAEQGDGPLEPTLPIIFVHGGAGSAAQYESQATRFDSNGYAAPVTALEYDSSSAAGIVGAGPALAELIDEIRDETGAPQVYVVGHSLGTGIMNAFLANPDNAARVAKYIGIDGASNPTCGLDDPNLSCRGIFAGSTGDVGGDNVFFDGTQSHVEVATSAESFAAQHEFFTGEPPATTLVLPERPRKVEISGRVVQFPTNVGADGTTLQIWEVRPDTGERKGRKAIAVFDIDETGDWGPVRINGRKHYELHTIGGELEGHFYPQPFIRSNHLVRVLTSPPGSPVLENTHADDNHSAAVVIRNREWWGNHPSGNDDILNVVTDSASRGTEEALDILPGTGNGNIGLHLHDAEATPGESTLDLLPFFPTLAFQTGVDVFMPATDPPDGTITFENAPRGDTSRPQVVTTPNWQSTDHRIVVLLNDYVQDINSWRECMRARPSPCR